jgi:hypothetical protein
MVKELPPGIGGHAQAYFSKVQTYAHVIWNIVILIEVGESNFSVLING